MSHLDLNQPPKRLLLMDLVNGINEFFTSPGPNAGGVAFSVLFHDFTPFSFRFVSAQEVAEAVQFFSIFCFTHDILSADWKVSKIIPLPKISNPSDFSDYRPIAILPCLSKAFTCVFRWWNT
jgi:hypothetical protein